MHKYYDICDGILTDSKNLLHGDMEMELYTNGFQPEGREWVNV